MNLNEAGALAAILDAARRRAVVADAIPGYPATLTWGPAQRIGNDDLAAADRIDADVLDLFLYVQVTGAGEVAWAVRDLIPRYLSGWFIPDFDPDARDGTGRKAEFPYTCARCHDPARHVSWKGLCDGCEDEDHQARRAEAARLRRVRPEDMIPVPGELGEDPEESQDGYDSGAASLFPTNELMNPAYPEDDPFYERDQVAYVVREIIDGQLRVLTSFGHLGAEWNVGTAHAIRHDQTWHPLGTWAVIGFRAYRDGLIQGEIPDRPLRHWVFK